MAEKEKLPPLQLPRGGGVGKAEHEIRNRSADVAFLHLHYIGKEIADMVMVIN